MRRPAFFVVVLGLVFLAAGAFALGKAVSIQVRQGQVRSKPSYLSKVLGTLVYGERVANLGQKGDWLKVKSRKGLSGWVHLSAVTGKKVILSSGKTKANLKASNEELILAGKGFNSAVEKEYRAKNPRAAYARVNKAEKEHNHGPAKITAFLKNGGLKPLGLELKAARIPPSESSGGGEVESVGP